MLGKEGLAGGCKSVMVLLLSIIFLFMLVERVVFCDRIVVRDDWLCGVFGLWKVILY